MQTAGGTWLQLGGLAEDPGQAISSGPAQTPGVCLRLPPGLLSPPPSVQPPLGPVSLPGAASLAGLEVLPVTFIIKVLGCCRAALGAPSRTFPSQSRLPHPALDTPWTLTWVGSGSVPPHQPWSRSEQPHPVGRSKYAVATGITAWSSVSWPRRSMPDGHSAHGSSLRWGTQEEVGASGWEKRPVKHCADPMSSPRSN